MKKVWAAFFDNFFLLTSAILIIVGGLGIYNSISITLGIVSAILFIGIKLIENTKILVPPNFYLYLVFIFVLLGHTVVFGGNLSYFWVFLVGGFYWFIIYNIKDTASKYFTFFLIFLGILMLVLNIISRINGTGFLYPYSLYLPIEKQVLHNDMGDLWAVILTSIFYIMSLRKKGWYWIVGIVGLIVIGSSLSRSAILTLLVGSLYIFYNSKVQNKLKPVLATILVISTFLFLYFGFYKTTLFSRPYYWESVVSLIHSPLGIGMGNFWQVSSETALTHDLILEVAVGMGIFSVVFIVWLIRIIKSIFKNKGNILYKAVFIAIGTNFLFNTSYAVPAMVWIWFSALALT